MPWWSEYIGIPYGTGNGEYTCWALVRDVYLKQLQIDLPIYGEVGASELLLIARTMEEAAASDGWIEVMEPQEYDVILMRAPRGNGRVVHVGVVAGGGCLHVEQSTATCLVPLQHFSVAGRIKGFRRRADGN
ncbi:hypothetical protein CDV50_10200 [Haematobacter massiliensis]|uniref:NlpC/P60 family protein n=1 Tax=Haematobacter massiliensis TaxID=195105 RepID=UPI000B497BAF|nr:NlpC/P60 family protein [Haematobacter massiliensis]OWJ71368.1 hypothetical protein CDV50_10200 [Haematobacter massiliensis]